MHVKTTVYTQKLAYMVPPTVYLKEIVFRRPFLCALLIGEAELVLRHWQPLSK